MNINPEAQRILDSIARNTAQVDAGIINPAFANLPTPISDPTSSISAIAEELALSMHQVAPIHQGTSSVPPTQGQTRAEIKKTAMLAAASVGMILEPALLEDMYVMSAAHGDLSDRDIWMYLKGALRNGQVSNTAAMAKLIANVEAILERNRQSMASNLDSNKQITERLTLIVQKVDSIVAPICALVQSEFKLFKDTFSNIRHTGSPFLAPASVLASSSSPAITHPGKEEILKICKTAGCPLNYAEAMAEKYQGIVTWEEYNTVISGTVSVPEIKKMMAVWKKKATS
ncbi:TPA_asm: P [Coptis gammacytorhabdovirus 1]|nr:TPA_asm: P [Coptis gammacytorhabdovirus 1]